MPDLVRYCLLSFGSFSTFIMKKPADDTHMRSLPDSRSVRGKTAVFLIAGHRRRFESIESHMRSLRCGNALIWPSFMSDGALEMFPSINPLMMGNDCSLLHVCLICAANAICIFRNISKPSCTYRFKSKILYYMQYLICSIVLFLPSFKMKAYLDCKYSFN